MTVVDVPVAVVTGSGGGIGRGIALALARAGHDIVVNEPVSSPGAEATATAVRQLGRRAVTIAADVRIAHDVNAMVDEIVTTFGHLDVLVNNAGVQTWGPLVDVTEADWDRVIDTNLKG